VRPYTISWAGDDVRLRGFALQYEVDPASGAPTKYTGYDEFERTLNDSDDTDWTVSWKKPAFDTARIEARAVLPDGYSVLDMRLSIRMSDDPVSSWFLTTQPTNERASFLVPDLKGASFDVGVRAGGPQSTSLTSVRNVKTSAMPVTVMVEPGPTAKSPLDGAADVGIGSVLSWDNPAHLPGFVTLGPTVAGPLRPYFELYTAHASVRIPDFSRLGVRLPKLASYDWSVVTTTAESLDDLASQGGQDPRAPGSTYAESYLQGITTR
jgi:hypothetical protein